jgi:murein L,D-transpeptidase YafK
MNSRLWLGSLVLVMVFCATIMLPVQGFAAQKTITSKSVTNSTYTSETHTVPQADQIVVYKSKRLMYLMKDGHILRKYRVALGKNPMGNKMEWGDFRTPEGRYHIDLKNANSGYFRSLRISYPDNSDADVAAALDVKPGDWVMIHGLPNDRNAEQMGHPDRDWTNGCIAVNDDEMMEIWDMVQVGTPISIWP